MPTYVTRKYNNLRLKAAKTRESIVVKYEDCKDAYAEIKDILD